MLLHLLLLSGVSSARTLLSLLGTLLPLSLARSLALSLTLSLSLYIYMYICSPMQLAVLGALSRQATSDEHRAMAYKSQVLELGTSEWVKRLGKHKWVQEEEVRDSFIRFSQRVGML